MEDIWTSPRNLTTNEVTYFFCNIDKGGKTLCTKTKQIRENMSILLKPPMKSKGSGGLTINHHREPHRRNMVHCLIPPHG